MLPERVRRGFRANDGTDNEVKRRLIRRSRSEACPRSCSAHSEALGRPPPIALSYPAARMVFQRGEAAVVMVRGAGQPRERSRRTLVLRRTTRNARVPPLTTVSFSATSACAFTRSPPMCARLRVRRHCVCDCARTAAACAIASVPPLRAQLRTHRRCVRERRHGSQRAECLRAHRGTSEEEERASVAGKRRRSLTN